MSWDNLFPPEPVVPTLGLFSPYTKYAGHLSRANGLALPTPKTIELPKTNKGSNPSCFQKQGLLDDECIRQTLTAIGHIGWAAGGGDLVRFMYTDEYGYESRKKIRKKVGRALHLLIKRYVLFSEERLHQETLEPFQWYFLNPELKGMSVSALALYNFDIVPSKRTRFIKRPCRSEEEIKQDRTDLYAIASSLPGQQSSLSYISALRVLRGLLPIKSLTPGAFSGPDAYIQYLNAMRWRGDVEYLCDQELITLIKKSNPSIYEAKR